MQPLDVNTMSLEAIASKSPEATASNGVTRHKPTALVFDSGVGGLSVYHEIRQLLPDLKVIYAFDNAVFPYGEKSEDVIVDRVVSITSTVAQLHPIDIVVIACNTASTVSLPALRARFTIPIVGVVPAIKPAVALTRNGVVGLLATRATVQRSYTHDLISRFAAGCDIKLLGSSRLVQMAEDKLHGIAIDLAELKSELAPWLKLEICPDTVVLGCTHFPLLKEELSAVLPAGTKLVDSGAAIARRVASLLNINLDSGLSPAERYHNNIAYCTQLNRDAALLRPVLQEYGFVDLRDLGV